MAKTRILTGITTTGTPHLGNYVGAIRPAIAASRNADAESFFFLADYHALVKCDDPARIQQSTLEIAASWLACELDTEKVYFYRQSDIPEIPELTWLLTCVTAKGLLNRAHAYKAATDANRAAGEDPDAGINAGLYMYPVLMAADILLFNANKVPVGRDQVQHIEMARDIGQRFNHIYGGEYFTLPEAAVEKNVATLPGIDGRKMSKSYNNTIPLFQGGEKALRNAIMSMVTDATRPKGLEDAVGSATYQLIGAFRSDHELGVEIAKSMREHGEGWGALKEIAYRSINGQIGGFRETYEKLIADPDEIEDRLRDGAKRVRDIARPTIERLREAVGIRRLVRTGIGQQDDQIEKLKVVSEAGKFVGPYREGGAYKFRLENAKRDSLFVSRDYSAYPEAAQALSYIRRVRSNDVELGRLFMSEQMMQDLKEAGSGNLLGSIVLNHNPSGAALIDFLNEVESLRNAETPKLT